MARQLILNELEMDMLREVGSIGASHATNSLAEMTGTKVSIEVPALEIRPVEQLISREGGEELVAGVYVELEGDVNGVIVLMLDIASALQLVEQITGMPPAGEELTEMEVSVLQEVGNIMASHFSNALADFLGMKIMPMPPALAVDMAAALLDFIMLEQACKTGDAILFKTRFIFQPRQISGNIFLMPDPESLDRIVTMLREKVGLGA
ncbi:chemotaxis protein CheC [Candidatus Pyrohabitans sp.]